MSSLYFLSLLFKYLSIVLGNMVRSRGRHNDTGKKSKIFFCLYIFDLDTIMGSSDKLNRTLKA